MGLSSIVDVTTATTVLLMAEVRLSEARYAIQASAAAVAFATGIGYQQF
jgi:outer membrane protein TolC